MVIGKLFQIRGVVVEPAVSEWGSMFHKAI